jgi:hypothetical protein
MITKEQKITRTSFKQQADVIAALLRTNPMINDSDKLSMNETVGVLIWLNQLQLQWEAESKPGSNDEAHQANQARLDSIYDKIFSGRKPAKASPPPV